MRIRAWQLLVVGAAVLLLSACLPGTPDLAFGSNGVVTYASVPGGAGGTLQLVAGADGGVVATRSSPRPLTRISPDGVVDPAWGSGLPNGCWRFGRASATGTGVLFTCSHLSNGSEVWQLWRVTAAGALDPTFGGGDGIVDVPSDRNAFDAVPLAGGGYLGIGHAVTFPSPTGVPPLLVTVYSATGAVVGTTSVDVALPALPAPFDGWAMSVQLAPTATGAAALEVARSVSRSTSAEVSLARVQHFDASGAALDAPSLNGPTGGNIIGSDTFTGFTVLADGRAALAGTTTAADIEHHFDISSSWLRVLEPDGSPDPGFGTGGSVRLQLPSGARIIPGPLVATTTDRFLVVTGAATTGVQVVARYDAGTGASDPTYGTGGFQSLALHGHQAIVARSDAPQLYVAGFDSQNRPAVTRIWNQAA